MTGLLSKKAISLRKVKSYIFTIMENSLFKTLYVKIHENAEKYYSSVLGTEMHEKFIHDIPDAHLFFKNTDFLSVVSKEEEQLIAALAMAPLFFTHLLERMKIIHTEYSFSELMGGKKNASTGHFQPTVRTALFVLAGTDTAKRIAIIKNSLAPDSPLFRFNILKPLHVDPLVEDDVLECTPEFIYKITSENKEEYQYTYSSAFPATLYTTNETWDDLCLNTRESIDLDEVQSWLKNYQALKNHPLLGKSHKGYKALFYGPPGTGKTISVGLLAKDVKMPVYRIDLSQIVSKWVGETEKNLKYIFDLASNKNWILFFDEGDALFGKRTDNSSANDRYGNQEIAYLLQRMEEFEGIIFLCTNKATNMDDAFKRRFNSRVEFSLPRKEESFMIWKKYVSGLDTVLTDSDLKKIVEKLEVSGASIKNFCKWMTILQYENLHKKSEDLENSGPIDKPRFLTLLNRYFTRYEGKSLDERYFI
jgi:AAA+ superfamily predicted ATPase